MLDPRGKNPKCRPGLVLNREHQPGEKIVVAANTTAFDSQSTQAIVEIPCDGTTLLKRPSAVVCDWLVLLDEADIVSVGGSVSAVLMLEVIRRLPKKANHS